MIETLADIAWKELDSIVEDVDKGYLRTEPPEGAEAHIVEHQVDKRND